MNTNSDTKIDLHTVGNEATFVELVERRAAARPNAAVFHFVESGDVDGETTTITYSHLLHRSHAIG